MAELKNTNYELVEWGDLLACDSVTCRFFGDRKFFEPTEFIFSCPKCGSTEYYECDSADVYNFFVNKINQIKEIIDVKS